MSRTCEPVTRYLKPGKKDFVDMIKLKTKRWGDEPALPRWVQSNHMAHSKQRAFPGCERRERCLKRNGQREVILLGLKTDAGTTS